MELTPEAIRSATFASAKRGYDTDAVDRFKLQVADELAEAQAQAAAMEARARAAVAKLQQLTAQADEEVAGADDEIAERASRTLVLAQRTADAAIEDARLQAAAMLQEAHAEAERIVESSRTLAARMVAEAREEAIRAGDVERDAARHDVAVLRDRCAVLAADGERLDAFLEQERARLREAAATLLEFVERVPAGIAAVRAPEVSDLGDALLGERGSDALDDAAHSTVPDAAPSDTRVLAATAAEPLQGFWDDDTDAARDSDELAAEAPQLTIEAEADGTSAETGEVPVTVGGADLIDQVPAEVVEPAPIGARPASHAASAEAAPTDVPPADTASADIGSDDTAPDDTASADTARDDTAPDDTAEDDTGPHRTGPAAGAPDDGARQHHSVTSHSEAPDPFGDWDDLEPAGESRRDIDQPWDDIPVSARARRPEEFGDDTFWALDRPDADLTVDDIAIADEALSADQPAGAPPTAVGDSSRSPRSHAADAPANGAASTPMDGVRILGDELA